MPYWKSLLFTLICILGLTAPVAAAPAQQQSVTFPETGFTVRGRFLQYWQQHGGLPVFGYPLSNELQENGYTVQYFERQRFELHPELAAPYDVLLGRLGDELLQRNGIIWQNLPTTTPSAGCLYFPTTRHNVCDQQPRNGFLTYWRTHGLEFDGQPGKSYAESLALFGLPLTEPFDAQIEGKTFQVQWFERARFEWHPENAVPFTVLLGRLGAEYRSGTPPTNSVDRVKIALIALEDNGQTGKKIGCNDSVVLVERAVPPTTAPLTAALNELLMLRTQFYGQSGLYNALYQSSLQLSRVTIDNGRATIELTGSVTIGGVCDTPRVIAQLQETALQFSTVKEVVVLVNGQRLEAILSER